jgi:3-oxoacyl-[acyl-carrier protein] reductase
MAIFDLSGKTALVTGASGAIGAAIAKLLHQQGAFVILSGTREKALAEVAQSMGTSCHFIPANLSVAEDIERLANESEQVTGSLDILVNNAGLTKDGLAIRMKDEDWQNVLDVDLTASFRLIRSSLKGMMKRRYGRIINITSVVGVTGNPGQANYCAAKAGLIGLSKSLALEVATRGITVNCVAPGFIATPMTDILNDDQKSKITQNIPTGRMGEPEEIASAVLYLASSQSSYVTGQTLHVNGGLAMI